MTPPPKKKAGCWTIGCFILIGFLLVVGLVGGCAAWKAWQLATGFTSTKPAEMPAFKADPAQREAFTSRVAAFQKALQEGKAASLQVSASDLNTAIALDPQYKEVRGRVFFAIERDVLSARLSVPLDAVKFLKGRWLNADAGIAVTFKEGNLRVDLSRVEVNGKAVPPQFTRPMSEAFQQKFMETMHRDPKAAEAFGRIQRFQVEGDHLVIESRGAGPSIVPSVTPNLPPTTLPTLTPPPAPPPVAPPEAPAAPAAVATNASPVAPAPRYVGRKLEDVKRELGAPAMTTEEGEAVTLQYPKLKVISADGVTVTAEKVEE